MIGCSYTVSSFLYINQSTLPPFQIPKCVTVTSMDCILKLIAIATFLGGRAPASRAGQDLRGAPDPVRAAHRGQEPGQQGDDPARRPHEDARNLRRDDPAVGGQGRRGAAAHVRGHPAGVELCCSGNLPTTTVRQCCQMAKFDPFLSLDCQGKEGIQFCSLA